MCVDHTHAHTDITNTAEIAIFDKIALLPHPILRGRARPLGGRAGCPPAAQSRAMVPTGQARAENGRSASTMAVAWPRAGHRERQRQPGGEHVDVRERQLPTAMPAPRMAALKITDFFE